MVRVLLSLWLALAAITASHAELRASVDRADLQKDETLRLTVEALLDDAPFSLFDLNTLKVPQPELGDLESQFEILGQDQRYAIQFTHNVSQTRIYWEYTLLPRRTGTLTIPPIRWRDQQTQPITLQVTDTPQSHTQAPPVFIETEWDTNTALPGEQRLLQVRLLFREDLTQGELSHPDHPKAQVIQLGKQTEFTRLIRGQRYHGRLRRYAVFADAPGTLEWPPITFRGLLLGGPDRTLRKRSATAIPPPLTIRPLPQNAPTPWLPARTLTLSESWSPPVTTLKVGDSLSREIRIEARGLDAARLAELTWQTKEGLRLYNTPPQRHTRDTADGLVGTLSQSWTLVATRPGRYTLPPLQITYWDTRQNAPATVRLNSRTLVVEGAPLSEATSHGSSDTAGQKSSEATEAVWPWQLATALLAVTALGLLAALMWQRRRSLPPAHRVPVAPSGRGLTPPPAYTANPSAYLSAARQWLDQHAVRTLPKPVQAAYEAADQLQRTLDARLYGPGHMTDTPGDVDARRLKALASELKTLYRLLEAEEKKGWGTREEC